MRSKQRGQIDAGRYFCSSFYLYNSIEVGRNLIKISGSYFFRQVSFTLFVFNRLKYCIVFGKHYHPCYMNRVIDEGPLTMINWHAINATLFGKQVKIKLGTLNDCRLNALSLCNGVENYSHEPANKEASILY